MLIPFFNAHAKQQAFIFEREKLRKNKPKQFV